MPRPNVSFITALAAALLLVACTSQDQRAAAAAATAQQLLDSGQPKAARALIRRALSERDDVGDYWLLLAQIDLADRDLVGAFDAYQNVTSFDRANVEALTRLCQIALAIGAPERAEKYADQLALISVDPTLPNTVKASAAFFRGRKDEATRLLGEVLKAHPDDVGALMLQGRMHEAEGNYAAAAQALEQSIAVGRDSRGQLEMLLEYYKGARDRDGYARTVTRLARISPADLDAQLAYADLLYEQGEREKALRVLQALMTQRPDDIKLAAAIVNLWLRQGDRGLPERRRALLSHRQW